MQGGCRDCVLSALLGWIAEYLYILCTHLLVSLFAMHQIVSHVQ